MHDTLYQKIQNLAPVALGLFKTVRNENNTIEDFVIVDYNDQFKSFFQPRKQQTLKGSPLSAYSQQPHIDYADFLSVAKRVATTNQTQEITFYLAPQDKHLQISLSKVDDDHIALYGMNISKYESLKQNFDTQEKHLRAALDATPDLVAIKDTDHHFLMVNEALRKRYKHIDQVEGKNIHDIYPEKEAKWSEQMDNWVIKHKKAQRRKMTMWDPDDNNSIADITRAPIIQNGEVIGIISIGRDITEQENLKAELSKRNKELKELSKQFKTLSYLDDLSGLYNRRKFYEDLESFYDNDDTHIIMIDLNHFKRVNDTYGHHYGDKALKDFAAELKKYWAPLDTIYRLGGDEFTIIFSHHQAKDLTHFVNTMNAQLKTYHHTLSMGYGYLEFKEIPREKRESETILKRIDKRLYQNKASKK